MISNIIQEISKVIVFILSLPKTLIFNFYYLPFNQAIKLPIFISYRLKLRDMRGTITIDQCKTGIIQIGFNSFGFIVGHGESLWSSTAHIHFQGKVRIGCNPKLRLSGKLSFGDNFEAGHELLIICQNHIHFEKDVLLSWNVNIMDADGHMIYNDKNQEVNQPRPIFIGQHAWLGCHSTILKGSHLPAESIVAAHSVVTKKIHDENCIIAGNPAKIIQRNRCRHNLHMGTMYTQKRANNEATH